MPIAKLLYEIEVIGMKLDIKCLDLLDKEFSTKLKDILSCIKEMTKEDIQHLLFKLTKEYKEILVLRVQYGLKEEELNEFNEYTMICDHYMERKIECYMNGYLIGTIYFEENEKDPYEEDGCI